jgi:hypothetical protein
LQRHRTGAGPLLERRQVFNYRRGRQPVHATILEQFANVRKEDHLPLGYGIRDRQGHRSPARTFTPLWPGNVRDGNQGTPVIRRLIRQPPGGQVKVLHLWPGQTPPADAMGQGMITH